MALEETLLERHEFFGGQMFLLAGGITAHNRIAGLLYAKMLEASADTNGEVFIENVKLRCPDEVFYHPDVMLACQEDDKHHYFRTSPCVLVEVLSESTAAIDRGEKLLRYCTIPSLQMYVLLAQDTIRAEVYRRNSDNSWQYTVLKHDDVLEFSCINLSLAVSSLYRGVF